MQVNVGDVVVIDWKVGEHNDINITEGGGVVFKWNDVVPHNVIEMTSKESVSETCAYVGENASALGKVRIEFNNERNVCPCSIKVGHLNVNRLPKSGFQTLLSLVRCSSMGYPLGSITLYAVLGAIVSWE